MVLLREKGTTADCLQIMAYSINCHVIPLLQMVVSILPPYAFTAIRHIRHGFICRDLLKEMP